jgi:hypothetical protein
VPIWRLAASIWRTLYLAKNIEQFISLAKRVSFWRGHGRRRQASYRAL